jgi:hypothetical protein
MTDEIQRVLVLSTAHVSNNTKRLLHHDDDCVGVSFEKGRFGWWVWVDTDGPDPDNEPEDMPADLRAVCAYARALQCGWVCLDCDAEINPSLPTY